MLRERGIKKSDLSREDFLKYAWEWKEKYGGIILEQLKKLGASCDWDRTSFTMDPGYYRDVVNVFIDLYNKGYIYRGQWQLDAPVHEVKDHSITTLRHQLIETRAILGQRVSLYQIHSADSTCGVLDDHAVLNELRRLREQGLCVGLTVTGPRQRDVIRQALDIRVDGVMLFDTVQATWNRLEPSAGDALADAHREGWGVIVKEALANGRLTNRFGGPELRDLRERASDLETAVETLAMAATLAQPWADVVLSGAVTRRAVCGREG